MNPESPQIPREELEAKLTALLLGELPAEQAMLLREIIARDPQLAALQDRLKQSIDLLRETTVKTAQQPQTQAAPLKLSAERREKLLASFKTLKPRELAPPHRRVSSRLVLAAVAAAIILFLSAIALPNFSRAKSRSQRMSVLNNLRQIDGAIQQWALENNKSASDKVTFKDIEPYMGRGASGAIPRPVAGEKYVVTTVGKAPVAEVGGRVRWRLDGDTSVASAAPSTVALSQDDVLRQEAFKLREDQAFRERYGLAPSKADRFQISGQLPTTPLAQAQPGATAEAKAPLATVVLPPVELAQDYAQLPGSVQTYSAGGGGGGGGGAGNLSFGTWSLETDRKDSRLGTDLATARPQLPTSAREIAPAIDPTTGLLVGANTQKIDPATGLPVGIGPNIDPATGLPIVAAAPQADEPRDGDFRYHLDLNRNGGFHRNGPSGKPADLTDPVYSPRTPAQIGKPFEAQSGGTTSSGADTVAVAGTNLLTGWMDNMHSKQGGVGLAEGAVQQFSPARLREALRNSGDQGVPSITNLPTAGVLWGEPAAASPPVQAPVEEAVRRQATRALKSPKDSDWFNVAKSPNQAADSTRSYLGGGAYGGYRSITALPHAGVTNVANAGEAPVVGEPDKDRLLLGVTNDAFFTAEAASASNAYSLQVRGFYADAPLSGNGTNLALLADVPTRTLRKPEAENAAALAATVPATPALKQEVEELGDLDKNVRETRQKTYPNDGIPTAFFSIDPETRRLPGTNLSDAESLKAVETALTWNGAATVDVGSNQIKDEKAAPPTVTLTGINSGFGGQKRALLKVQLPTAGRTLAEQSYVLTEGQKKGGIQVLKIDDQSGTVEVNDSGRVRILKLNKEAEIQKADPTPPKLATNAPIPQPEVLSCENAFSTFSMNVSDVSFKLAAASLEKGLMPDPSSVRSEEFINAFDYRDPEPAVGAPLAFAWERARYPFAQDRDLLRFSIKTAAEGRQASRPLNIVLLLDTSGSMERADRVQIIREALQVLAAQLHPQDKFSVVTFARTAKLWVDGISGDQAGKAATEVSNITPEGGTNLEDAMNLAYQTASRHYQANGINRVVLLTDGAANLGNVTPDSLKQKVESNRKQGIALDCFGIGWEGYNDDLLEVLSRNGDGRYGFLNTPEEASTEFVGQLAGALHVAAADVKVQIEFNPARVTAYRQIGYAKHQLTKEQFRDNTVDAAEIGAAESGNALYVIEVNPAGEGPLATVRVRFKVPGTQDYREHEWPVPYNGNSVTLDQASSALRLAATASAFSEWLVSSPYAGEVTPDGLIGYLSGVPEVYGADARPKKLEWMIRQAKSIAGGK